MNAHLEEAAAGFARMVKLGVLRHATPVLKISCRTPEEEKAYSEKRAKAHREHMRAKRRIEKKNGVNEKSFEQFP